MAKSSISGGSKSGYIGFAKQAAFGAAAGAVVDAFCEISKFPVLNDASQLGGPNTSNAEVVIYGTGLLMTVLGLLDLVGGVRFGGIGKELLPTGMGLIIGTHYYESDLANIIGVRGAAPAAATPAAAKTGGNFSAGNYDFAGDVF